MSYNPTDEMLSSPDPLNNEPMYTSPAKSRRTTKSRASLPSTSSSPRKQTFELDVGNKISPQKIRVTVEADNSDKENGFRAYGGGQSASPTNRRGPAIRRNERTTTTTIPVKGLEDSDEEADTTPVATPKRGRGRPRKSTGTPVPSKSRTRTVTPGGRRRRTLGELVDGDDSEDWDFQIGANVEVGRGKGRSRSRSVKGNKQTPATGDRDNEIAKPKTTKKSTGRRKSLAPEEIIILADDSESNAEIEPDHTLPETSTGNDGNVLMPKSSNSSTIRSATASTRKDSSQPDILLAEFERAETPTERGWSSPTVWSAPRSGSSTHPQSIGPPTSTQTQETLAKEVVRQETSSVDRHSVEDYEDEDDGGYREFDTIMESEGFSMISVDSVPSLREHLSSPPTQDNHISKPRPNPVNKSLLSVKATDDDSFSSVPPEVLQAATPAKPVMHRNIASVHQANKSGLEDSFSSIAPDILEAATPGRRLQNHNLLSGRLSSARANDSFSSVPPSVLNAATPKPLPKNKLLREGLSKQHHDDSFSSVSSAVLKAATSPKSASISGKDFKENSHIEGHTTIDSIQLIPADGSLVAPVRERESSRLLTPEETPSPPLSFSQLSAQHSTNKLQSKVGVAPPITADIEADSSLVSQMRSSPPSLMPRRFTYNSHLRDQQRGHGHLAETPAITFSSPTLPPPIQAPLPRGQSADDSKKSQQGLLPIVRAGRALQDIVVPSTSPRSRSQSLGSPFKSPIAQRKSDPLESSSQQPDLLKSDASNLSAPAQASSSSKLDDGLFEGFSSGTRRELRKSFMMGQQLAVGKTSPSRGVQEDPFQTAAPRQGLPSSRQSPMVYTLNQPGQPQKLYPSFDKATIPQTGTVRSEGAMSWQAETPIILSSDTSSQQRDRQLPSSKPQSSESRFSDKSALAQQREEGWTRERRTVSENIKLENTSNVVVINSDEKDLSVDMSTESQRSLPAQVELEQVQEDEDMDIWLEEAKNSSQLEEEDDSARDKPFEPVELVTNTYAEAPRRSKIPSPWRQNSRRLVYSDELANAASSPPGQNIEQAAKQPEIQFRRTEPVATTSKPNKNPSLANGLFYTSSTGPAPREDSSELSDCSQMQHIPQKSNFAPRVRPRESGHLDLSALLGSSPVKLPRSNPPSSFQGSGEMNEQRLRTAIRQPTFTVSPRLSVQDKINEILAQDESPVTQEESLTEDSTEHSYDDRSERSLTPVAASSSSLIYPLLNNVRPLLPSAQTPSPKKGLLRTSSGDSPTKNVVWVGLSSSPTANKSKVEQNDLTTTETDVSVTDISASDQILSRGVFAQTSSSSDTPIEQSSELLSSPVTPKSPAPPRLSSTTWSKAHWKLLNNIFLDVRSSLPLSPELEAAYQSSKLLGKVVRGEGEKMYIEAWHLDIVACFLDDVPGWDEATLMRRVFGLVKGEERRQRAKAESLQG